MNIRTYLPSAALRPFVRALLIVESPAAASNCVLPDTALVLAFRLRGCVALGDEDTRRVVPAAVITGLKPASQTLHYTAASATLLVLLQPGGGAAFFRAPLHELFGVSEPLDSLLPGKALRELEDQLTEAPGPAQQVALVERFLLARLQAPKTPPLVGRAVQLIAAHHGAVRIREVAATLASSQDALEKQFRRAVGAGPKWFAAIVRFRHLLSRPRPGHDLTAAAHAAGYFDQSHFIRDFKAFTGQAPSEFFRAASYW